MSGANELLYWLSATSSGSWGQFRAAVDRLIQINTAETFRGTLPLHQRLRLNLQQLGHVEFNARTCPNGWRVAVPVLAMSEGSNKVEGVICGARLPGMAITAFPGITASLHSIQEAPDVIKFSASEASHLRAFATHSGLQYQERPASSILACLPQITDLSAWHCRQADTPFGRDVVWEMFQLSRRSFCTWTSCTTNEAKRRDGLYRLTRYQRRTHYLRRAHIAYIIPGQLGNYFIAAQKRRKLLKYNSVTKNLDVPASCRPPLLVDRALILCSGFPPVHNPQTRTLRYSSIPEDVAGLAAFVLCQDRL